MEHSLSAILLAAGVSSRMGRPKMLLPWGDTTVLGRVISVFAAGLTERSQALPKGESLRWEIVIVTGGARDQVERFVADLPGGNPLRTVYNPLHAEAGMLSSIQAGLRSLDPQVEAVLIGLGDQPQVQEKTVRDIVSIYLAKPAPLVVPSYRNQRGHPWLVDRSLWPEMLGLPTQVTPRQFLAAHPTEVEYVPADGSILQDLDTPEDYDRSKP